MKKAEKAAARLAALIPNGTPRYLRIYDNGGHTKPNGTADRYTVVFTGKHDQSKPYHRRQSLYLGMSGNPYSPQGFCQHGHGNDPWPIDRPTSSHLGKKIKWKELPEDCQRAALDTYKDIWGLNPEERKR